MEKQNKKNIFTLLIIPLFFGYFFCFANTAKADYWNAAMLASIWKRTMERIDKKMDALIMSIEKELAVNTIVKNVTKSVSGGSSGKSLIIEDWNQYLFEAPHEKAHSYMDDYFSSTTSGRGEAFNYEPGIDGVGAQLEPFNYEPGIESSTTNCPAGSKCIEGVSTVREGVVKGSSMFGGVGGNYENYLIQQAKKITTDIKTPKNDLRNYVSDPTKMFATGNWRAFSSFISNPANNPFGYSLNAREEWQSKLSKEQKLAEMQGLAYSGFKPVTSGGMVTTPGSIIKDVQSQAFDLGNKVVAAADDPEEVIMAVVNKVIDQAFSGIGSMGQKASQKSNGTIGNYSRENTRVTNNPGVNFKPRY